MRKIFYLCGMMLLCMDMMAQIDLNDKNWRKSLEEGFTVPGRTWIDWSFKSSDGRWRAYPGSGVTHGKELMVYHHSQCQFNDIDKTMELVSEYDTNKLIPANGYTLPSWMYVSNNGPGYPESDSLFFFSGSIDHCDTQIGNSGKFRYGYFEIRCKLPIHQGAFPAFWLWDAREVSPTDKYYEEIDIFEYSWSFEDTDNNMHGNHNPHGAGNPYCFTTGIYYSDTTKHHYWQNSFARNFPMISDSMSHWHTFACEWLPKHIIWYCDGNVVNEYHNPDSIPRHHLTLKANYAIDRYALERHKLGNPVQWEDGDKMIIDWIKVYQLEWDCDTDETIARQSDLDGFAYAVKKSISITSAIEPISVRCDEKVTFRATDSFEITGSFQTDVGTELTVIMQECPE